MDVSSLWRLIHDLISGEPADYTPSATARGWAANKEAVSPKQSNRWWEGWSRMQLLRSHDEMPVWNASTQAVKSWPDL